MNRLKFLISKPFLITLAKMLAILIILVFALKIWLGFSTNHNQKIPVPDLSKMTLLKMKVTLDESDLAYKILDTASFNPKYPPLTVIEQNPEFGEFVKAKRKIYITLNPSGYREISFPDLLGRTKRQVEMHLKSIGFKVGTFSYVPDRGRNVVRGLTFNGKRLKVGDKVPKNSKINLVLGDGRGSFQVKDTLQ